MSFLNFLKQYHADAFKDYIRENFSDKQKERRLAESEQETTGQEQTAEPIFYATMDLPKLSDLPEDHDAVKYFKDRKIPTCYMKYFRYSENYKAWVNTKIPDKFSHINDDDRRIVIPFYTIDRKLFGCAGRALDNENVPKYIPIRFNDVTPKIFGMERVDLSKDVFVFEGQIDSLFIPNGIAICGSDIDFKTLSSVVPADKIIFVYDNEINEQIFKRIEKVVDAGFRISLLPKEMRKYGKDINEYVKKGFTRKELYDMVRDNIYSGLKARTLLMQWKTR